jgi:hypothetical protein
MVIIFNFFTLSEVPDTMSILHLKSKAVHGRLARML